MNWLKILGFVLLGMGILFGLDYILNFGLRDLVLNFGLGNNSFQNTWDFLLAVMFIIGGFVALQSSN